MSILPRVAAFVLASAAMLLATSAWFFICQQCVPAPLLEFVALLCGTVLGIWVGRCVYDRLVLAWTAPKPRCWWKT